MTGPPRRFPAVFLGLLIALAARAQSNDPLAPLVQLLRESDDPQVHFDVLKGMSDGLKSRRTVPMPAGWETVAARLRDSPDAQVRDLVQALSLTFGSSAALNSLRQTLMDRKAAPGARKRALDSLLQVRDPALAAALLRLLEDPAMRAAALRGLAAYDAPEIPTAILNRYSSLNSAEKRAALNSLASRSAFARELLAAVRDQTIPPRDLTAEIVHQLRHLKDPAINEQVQRVWGAVRETKADKLAEMAKYKTKIMPQMPGSPRHGRAVFARVCQQCHTLFGVGGTVGPDITGANRSDPNYLLENILDPNAVIANDYRTATLETTDDRVITGIVARQDDRAVTIMTPGETLVVPRSEIHSLTQGEVSLMPEGLLQSLSDDEVRDLMAYLSSPAQVPVQATPENVGSLFNGRDLSGWEGDTALWNVENGEIVGRTTGLKHAEVLRAPLWLADFRLVCQVKLIPNAARCGIQFRSQPQPSGEMRGLEFGLGAGRWGHLRDDRGASAPGQNSGGASVKPGEWITCEILAIGSKVRAALNGHVCAELDEASLSRAGVLGFELGADGPAEVRFKDIQLELNPKSELVTAR